MKFIKDIGGDFSEFKDTFDQLSNYISQDKKVLVAVSGGPDSMFASLLVYKFFLSRGYNLDNLYFIHCNHKTRVETDTEQDFITSFLSGYNLSIGVYDGSCHKEDDLRTWRYTKFNEIIQKHNIDYLVTGHNLTDRIESSFMNMTRGAGLTGFLSMRFLDTNNLLDSAQIIRPLLSFTKKEVEYFCKKYDIPYVVDQTNFDKNTSLRNNIRLGLFPQLVDLSNKNTDINCSFFESMKQVYTDIENIERSENIGIFTPIKKSYYWNADFAYLREIPFGFINEKVLLIVLKKFNIYSDVSKSTLSDFLQFFKESKQGFKYINGVYFFISNGKIYIIKAKTNFWEKYIEKEIAIDKLGIYDIGKETVNVSDSNHIGCLLRYPKVGDKVGSKSWGEYCINKKIPVFWRNFIPVVEQKTGFVTGYTDVVL